MRNKRIRIARGVAAVAAVSTPLALAGAASPASAEGDFIPGSATAVATAVQVAPSTAGLNYAITLGTSVAGYRETLAQAQSKTLDLGSIGLALTGPQCDGSPPLLKQDQLPQPLIVESTGGNASQTTNTAGAPADSPLTLAAGLEQASVTTTPSAHAITTTTAFEVPGLFSVGAGRSETQSALVPNKSRTASATASLSRLSLAGGMVTLDGLHWAASQVTGAADKPPAATGSFSIAGITIAGQHVPVNADQVGAALKALNTALKPTGLHISYPQVTTSKDGIVRVSPLSIGIDGSALGQQLLGPVLGAIQPVRAQIADALLGVNCKTATALLLGDITTGAFSGAGGLDINLGGVSATSEGESFDSAFGPGGSGPTLGGGGPAGPAPAEVGGLSLGSTNGPTGDLTATPPGPVGANPGDVPQHPTVAAGPVTKTSSCTTTHPFGYPGCGSGHALAVGLAGLGAIALLGGLDYAAGWRRRHRLPHFTS